MSKKRRYPYKRVPKGSPPNILRPPSKPTSPDGWANYIKHLIRYTTHENRTYYTTWLRRAAKAANTGAKLLGGDMLEITENPV